jgi:hypothetical protein
MSDLGPTNDVEPDCYMRGLDVFSVGESSVRATGCRHSRKHGVSSVGESSVRATGCRHSRKHGHYVVVSATYVCRVTLYASERPVSGYQHLTGSELSKRWYHQLRYIMDMLTPVRLPVQQK